MKKTIYTLMLVLGLSAFSTVQGVELTKIESSNKNQPTGNEKKSVFYGYYYSNQIQMGIAPSQIVKISDISSNSNGKFDISSGGGMVVPFSGNYLISYRILANSQVSVALYDNEELIPESAFSNTSASPIIGSAIVYLRKRDVLTIRSIETSKTFNTVAPVSTTTPTLPVSVTLQYLTH